MSHLLDQYASPSKQSHMLLLFQCENAERSRRVKVVCYVKWEAIKLRDRSQFWDTEMLVSLCKDKKIQL